MDMPMSNSSAGMAFQSNSHTPLYAPSWTPSTPATYALTCIFLLLLALLERALLALRTRQERAWLARDRSRRYVAVQGRSTLAERLAHDPDAKEMLALGANGVEEKVVVVVAGSGGAAPEGRPWRLSVEPLRAALDTVIVGVGYLLMLAVMTMNVGYFLSVLAGVFLGSLLVGRYSSLPDHH